METVDSGANVRIVIESANVMYANPTRTVFPTGTININNDLAVSGRVNVNGDLAVTGNTFSTGSTFPIGSMNLIVFTANGTYTKPAGLKSIKVIVIGGGGSRATSNGGQGGAAMRYIPASALPASAIDIIVAANVATPSANIRTSFGGVGAAWADADRGTAGSPGGVGAGGAGSNGQINFTGAPGLTAGLVEVMQTQFIGGTLYGVGPKLSTNGTPGVVIVEEHY